MDVNHGCLYHSLKHLGFLGRNVIDTDRTRMFFRTFESSHWRYVTIFWEKNVPWALWTKYIEKKLALWLLEIQCKTHKLFLCKAWKKSTGFCHEKWEQNIDHVFTQLLSYNVPLYVFFLCILNQYMYILVPFFLFGL